MKTLKMRLNLIPITSDLRPKSEKPPLVRIAAINGSMTFNFIAIEEMGLNKKWIRMFYDEPRRALSWRVTDVITDEQKAAKAWKYVERNSTGSIVVGVGRYLSLLGVTIQGSQWFEVMKVGSAQGLLDEGEYFTIILSDPYMPEPR